MLTIICGEDSISSRDYYVKEVNKYKELGLEISNIYPKEIKNIFTGVSVQSLFGQNIIYCTENLNKFINKKNISVLNILKEISSDKNLILLDWENEISKRDLKYSEKSRIIEFRPNKNIFKLLESCYPANLKEFLSILNEISHKMSEYLILIMLIRHIKKLLLYKINGKVENLAYWQLKQIAYQSKLWSKDALIVFYDKLINIEILEKIGKNPYSVKNYIELLSVYYIK